jgi:probable rRNA maturation factor
MPDLIEAALDDARWEKAGLENLAERACRAALDHLELAPDAYLISLLGCDDARIARLNAEFRGKPTPTNVLSWPAQDLAPEEDGGAPAPPDQDMFDAATELGDIAISFDTCKREAAEQGKDFADHVAHLMVHGCLHLLGYDHVSDKDAALMEGLETAILAKLGVADPY